MNAGDCMQYAPHGRPTPVVKPGEFVFSVMYLEHGHIDGMTRALLDAGATLKQVYDPDVNKVAAFLKRFPQAVPAACEEEILQDKDVQLVCAAAITSQRCSLGLRVMAAGKDYFTDKGPFTTLEQLAQAREACHRTGRKYMVYFSERLHVEAAVLAGYMIDQGEIGRVIHVEGFGPHTLNAASRPDWFFRREQYGGILCDIGSHQIEQFLYYTGDDRAQVAGSRIGNYAHPGYPELDDFGDVTLNASSGASGYFRVDWFTPKGLSTWGDGRMFIMGTRGTIELRKYVNVASGQKGGNHLFLVNDRGEQYFNATDTVGFPFFGQLILDCLNRTEHAMTQEHAFQAAELCLVAQQQAAVVAP